MNPINPVIADLIVENLCTALMPRVNKIRKANRYTAIDIQRSVLQTVAEFMAISCCLASIILSALRELITKS